MTSQSVTSSFRSAELRYTPSGRGIPATRSDLLEVLFPAPILPAVPVRLLVAPAWSLGLLAPVAELEAELPFGEAFAEALAPPIGCPVISTCSPTCVRRASVLPVSV